ADAPAVVARRHVEEAAFGHHALGAVVHPNRRTAAEHEPDVLDLACRGAGGRPDVLRPAPAWLVGRAPDRGGPDAVELEAALLEVAGGGPAPPAGAGRGGPPRGGRGHRPPGGGGGGGGRARGGLRAGLAARG